MWSAVLDRILAHPKVAALLASAVLVPLAVPAFTLKTGAAPTRSRAIWR